MASEVTETQRQLPPGPRGLLRLEALSFRRDPLGFLTRLARRYGDIAHFRVGPQPVFLLNHPDYIREAFNLAPEDVRKGPALQRAKRLLGEGLLTSEGERHRRQRRLIQPAFHRKQIAAHARVIAEHGERLAARWREGETVDVLREMRRLTLAVVGRVLFGADVGRDADAVGEELAASIKLLNLFGAPRRRPFDVLRRLPFARAQRFGQARARLDAVTYRIISERRARGRDRGDLLSMLLAAQDEEGAMSDEQLRDEVMTLIQAGHETTANALTWTWYLLALNPDAEAKLHLELDQVLAGRAPTDEDVPRLPYAEMVFLEAMRLYPPAWMTTRFLLKEHSVGGYTLPAGALVILSQYVTHRDGRYYPEPQRFLPERWTQGERAARPPHAYFPFGGGARRCIGEGLAILEGVLLVATLANRWRLRLASDREVTPQPFITLSPRGGMPMRLERREGAPVVARAEGL